MAATVLEKVYLEASESGFTDAKNVLSYFHMIALAGLFESWVFDERLTPTQTAKLLGWSERFHSFATEVGEGWNPPPPAEKSVLRTIAKWALTEGSNAEEA